MATLKTIHEPVAECLSRHPRLEALEGALRTAVLLMRSCIQAGNKILICGNGGSAADSMHAAGELIKGFSHPRDLTQEQIAELVLAYPEEGAAIAASLQQGIPAIALSANPAVMTSIANDNGYELVFAQQVYALGRRGDVLLAISTSGSSVNVVLAAKVAQSRGLRVVSLTGAMSSELGRCSDINLAVDATRTHEIQELHLPLYHCICAALEFALFTTGTAAWIQTSPALVVFDFDGVFTDNKVYVLADGTEAVCCSRADSLGTDSLLAAGIDTFILSKETNPVVRARGAKIGVDVHSGCDDKATFLARYCEAHGIDLSRVVYMGNDVNDLEVMRLVGYPVCPGDAHPAIRQVAALTLKSAGGNGAVRELCDLLCSLC